jgi:hypothetical protein
MRHGLAAIILTAAMNVGPAAHAAPAERLFAGGSWAALRFGPLCQAAARPLPPTSSRSKDARAGFSFAPGRAGEFHVRLSRSPRPGSTVILIVGDRPFLLLARGEWAWSRGAVQDTAIIASVRAARSMRVEARDAGGRRVSDRYLLDGAPTAIDAAAAACAGKSGR